MIQPYIDFSATPASITADAERLVIEARHQRDELVRNIVPEQATFTNVMLALAQMQDNFAIEANILSFYRRVSADADIRAASAKAQNLFDDFHAECCIREDIFKLVDAVHQSNGDLLEESSLLLETFHTRFARSGLGIQDATSRERYTDIQSRLSKIHAEFQQNLGQRTEMVSFTLAELTGVPESIVGQLQTEPSSNKLRVDLSNPAHRNILSFALNTNTRKELYLAIESRCRGNVSIVHEAVELRYEMARLLGFTNYAAFQLQSRMAKTPGHVQEFLAAVRSKLVPFGLRSLEALKDLKKSDGNSDESFLWDYEFYQSRMLKSSLSIDRTRIKEYFPLQNTTTAILNLVAHLFGISFDEIKASEFEMWHKDVQMFAAHDNENGGGGFLGYLYLDLFKREGKHPHEACLSLQPVSFRLSFFTDTPHKQIRVPRNLNSDRDLLGKMELGIIHQLRYFAHFPSRP
ncbi:hypothetical protein NQ176_g7360 [Zarea fungicola]|uniref:Uncharacterized protein n=1 Tax=Zarea fungicola TaxID=93591 RepID=A0ACC1N0U0_9HYPO|nr:hypothetical protein NQ176_g7360 [Lecanicillium fungicola]